MMNAGTVKNVGREIGGMGVSITLGLVGGAICGAVILSFGALLGRSGTTGTEYVGYWDVGLVWVGFLYGGLFGMICGADWVCDIREENGVSDRHTTREYRNRCGWVHWRGGRSTSCGHHWSFRFLPRTCSHKKRHRTAYRSVTGDKPPIK